MPPPAVLFDLDGVLADSRGPITGCVNRALVALGHGARPVADLDAFIGPPTRIGFSELIGEPPESPAVEACVAEYRRLYAGALAQTPVVAGIPEVLDALRAEFRLGVATSKARHFAVPVVEAIGLAGVFAVVAGPELTAGAEEKAVTVAAAIDALGGGVVALVGDRRYDVTAAHANGIEAIGVTWGIGSEGELRRAGADVLVGRPGELPAALRSAATRAGRGTGP